MEKQKIFLGIALITFLVLSLNIVNAEVTQTVYVYEGRISEQGVFTRTQNGAIDNVNVIGFVCEDMACSQFSETLFSERTTGSDNAIQITYPTILKGSGYAMYFYKQGYFPGVFDSNYAGTGVINNPNDLNSRAYIYKIEDGRADISSINSPDTKQINQEIQIQTNILSPLVFSQTHPQEILDILEPYMQSDIKITLEIKDSNQQIIESQEQTITLNMDEDEDVSFTWTPDTIGDYTIKIKTNIQDDKFLDSQEQSQSNSITINPEPITPDTTKPEITILSPSQGTYSSNIIDLRVQLNEPGTALFSIDNNTETTIMYNDGDNIFGNTITLSNGIHTITFYATDSAGNTNSANVNFVVDNTAPVITDTTKPEITILSPSQGTYSSNIIDLRVQLNEPGTALFSIDNNTETTIMYNDGDNIFGNTITLSNGIHTITFYATDSAGNTNSANVNFVVDNTAPVITDTTKPIISVSGLVSGETYNTQNISISVISNEPLLEVYLFNNQAKAYLASITGSNRQTFETTLINLANNDYTITFYATDLAGNTQTLTLMFTIDISFTPDDDDDDDNQRSSRRKSTTYQEPFADSEGILQANGLNTQTTDNIIYLNPSEEKQGLFERFINWLKNLFRFD